MRLFVGCVLVVLLAGCGLDSSIPIHTRSDKLVVAVRELPTTYHPGGLASGVGGKGFEHDLLALFAESLGKELEVVALPSEADVLRHVRQRRVHLAAAWLSPPLSLAEGYAASRPFFTSQAVLLQHARATPIERPDELAFQSVVVRAGSTLANRLHAQREALLGGARIAERPDPTGVRLIGEVAEGKIALAAVDQAQVDLAQTFLPEVQSTLPIGEPRQIVWLLPANFDPELEVQVDRFLDGIEKDGRLARIHERYFGHVRRVNRIDRLEFISRIRTTLPQFQPAFVEGEEATGIDWRLLAALAYQESHWDPLATSKTGVRGMMMLTGDTADRMKVTNRLDPLQSIRAGSEYLHVLRDSLPLTIDEPDRTWIALAAYNVGMGHIYGARRLARRRGLDPDLWQDLRRALPLLARPEFYETLPSGRARGGEAVIMVENIRVFYDILRRHAPAYEPGFAWFD